MYQFLKPRQLKRAWGVVGLCRGALCRTVTVMQLCRTITYLIMQTNSYLGQLYIFVFIGVVVLGDREEWY